MKLRNYASVFTIILSAFVGMLISPRVADALSENLVIYQLQTAGALSGTASQEIILLYNQSAQDMNVTDWCIKYTSSTDTSGFSKCLSAPDSTTELWLSSGGMVSFATNEFNTANSGFVPDIVFSAGMAATGGHLRIVDNLSAEIDKVGWGTAVNPEGTVAEVHATGKVLSRDLNALLIDSDNNLNDFSSKTIQNPIASGLYEKEIIIDLCLNIDGVQAELPVGFLEGEAGSCFLDVCPNIDGLQVDVGTLYYIDEESGDCLLIPLEDRVLFITELLPNAPSSDTGQEYIEIYNPQNEAIILNGYRLQVGPSFTEEYTFESGEIGAGQYLAFSDTQTGIVLPNTTGVQLRLVAPAGNVVSISGAYSEAGDNVSWALVEDQWIYTNQITRAAANKPYLEPAVEEVIGVTTVLAPCPAGKYRNPATNRCRTVESAVSILALCDEDEYRNPDTNRCRKFSSTASSLSQCEAGQERNPETNRCRKVSVLGVSSESDLSDIQDVAVKNTEGQLNWSVIVATFGATLAYMIYEWRSELRQKLYLIRSS